MTNLRASRRFSLNSSYYYYQIGNDAPAGDLRNTDYKNHTLALQPVWQFNTGTIRHILTSSYQYQSVDNKTAFIADSLGLESQFINANWTIAFPAGFSFIPGVLFQRNEGGLIDNTVRSYSLGSYLSLLKNKLSLSANLSLVNTETADLPTNDQVAIRAAFTFQPTRKDRFVFNIRNTDQTAKNLQGGISFTEIRASLRYNRRL